MEFGKTDLAVFTYTLAAVYTGILLVNNIGVEGRVPILGMSAVLAALWTAYFKLAMAKRFRDGERGDEEGRPESAEPTSPGERERT